MLSYEKLARNLLTSPPEKDKIDKHYMAYYFP